MKERKRRREDVLRAAASLSKWAAAAWTGSVQGQKLKNSTMPFTWVAEPHVLGPSSPAFLGVLMCAGSKAGKLSLAFCVGHA